MFVVNGEVDYIERSYNFPNIRWVTREENSFNQICVLDLKTYAVDNTKDGMDLQEGYAGVKKKFHFGLRAVNGKGHRTFIIDNLEIKTGT